MSSSSLCEQDSIYCPLLLGRRSFHSGDQPQPGIEPETNSAPNSYSLRWVPHDKAHRLVGHGPPNWQSSGTQHGLCASPNCSQLIRPRESYKSQAPDKIWTNLGIRRRQMKLMASCSLHSLWFITAESVGLPPLASGSSGNLQGLPLSAENCQLQVFSSTVWIIFL